MQYNIFDRRPEEFLDELDEKNISVLARGPLAKGMLTNKAKEYINKKGIDGYLNYTALELEEIIEKLIGANKSMATKAFSYILSHPSVASAVFGARTMEQLADNLEYLPLPNLKNEELNRIKKMTKYFPYSLHR